MFYCVKKKERKVAYHSIVVIGIQKNMSYLKKTGVIEYMEVDVTIK